MRSEAVLEEAEDLILDLTEAEGDREKIAKSVAQFIDAFLPLDLLVPGPLGQLAEQVDQAALEYVVSHLMKVFHADPEKKAQRRQRRLERREARASRRAQRKGQGNGHGRSE
jgi:hypothetical protein